MVAVILYTTDCPGTLKARTDITRIQHILRSKKVQYEEVDLSEQGHRRQEMLDASDGVSALPQLHVNGRYIGTADDVQEFEDWGELDAVLRGVSPGELAAASAAAFRDDLPNSPAADGQPSEPDDGSAEEETALDDGTVDCTELDALPPGPAAAVQGAAGLPSARHSPSPAATPVASASVDANTHPPSIESSEAYHTCEALAP